LIHIDIQLFILCIIHISLLTFFYLWVRYIFCIQYNNLVSNGKLKTHVELFIISLCAVAGYGVDLASREKSCWTIQL